MRDFIGHRVVDPHVEIHSTFFFGRHQDVTPVGGDGGEFDEFFGFRAASAFGDVFAPWPHGDLGDQRVFDVVVVGAIPERRSCRPW